MANAVTVSLSTSSIDLLMAAGDPDEDPGGRLVAAVVYFLAEGGSDVAGGAYPEFRREQDGMQARDFELAIPADLWRRFTAEAERQRVSPDRMLEHAALFFAAHADAGRLGEDPGASDS
jgi:ADP-ribose pyrophosphatase YjhB (NUDIX family)